MSKGTAGLIKGVIGVVVVVVLLIVVANWWGDYQRAASKEPAKTATSTVESTKTTETTATAATTVVVLIDGLNFRKQPQADAATIRGLKKGEKLVLVKSQADWYQVKDSKGVVGFVAAKPQYVRLGE